MEEQIQENRKLFVWNLPWELRGKELADYFREYGEVEFATVVLDRETRRSKWFGFVTFENLDGAKNALEKANEKELNWRKIFISYAKESPDKKEEE